MVIAKLNQLCAFVQQHQNAVHGNQCQEEMRHVFAFLRSVMAALAAEGPGSSAECTAATAGSLAQVVSLLLAVRGCEGTSTYVHAPDVVVPLLCDLLRIVGVYDFAVVAAAEVSVALSQLVRQLELVLPGIYETLVQDFIELAETLVQLRIHNIDAMSKTTYEIRAFQGFLVEGADATPAALAAEADFAGILIKVTSKSAYFLETVCATAIQSALGVEMQHRGMKFALLLDDAGDCAGAAASLFVTGVRPNQEHVRLCNTWTSIASGTINSRICRPAGLTSQGDRDNIFRLTSILWRVLCSAFVIIKEPAADRELHDALTTLFASLLDFFGILLQEMPVSNKSAQPAMATHVVEWLSKAPSDVLPFVLAALPLLAHPNDCSLPEILCTKLKSFACSLVLSSVRSCPSSYRDLMPCISLFLSETSLAAALIARLEDELRSQKAAHILSLVAQTTFRRGHAALLDSSSGGTLPLACYRCRTVTYRDALACKVCGAALASTVSARTSPLDVHELRKSKEEEFAVLQLDGRQAAIFLTVRRLLRMALGQADTSSALPAASWVAFGIPKSVTIEDDVEASLVLGAVLLQPSALVQQVLLASHAVDSNGVELIDSPHFPSEELAALAVCLRVFGNPSSVVSSLESTSVSSLLERARDVVCARLVARATSLLETSLLDFASCVAVASPHFPSVTALLHALMSTCNWLKIQSVAGTAQAILASLQKTASWSSNLPHETVTHCLQVAAAYANAALSQGLAWRYSTPYNGPSPYAQLCKTVAADSDALQSVVSTVLSVVSVCLNAPDLTAQPIASESLMVTMRHCLDYILDREFASIIKAFMHLESASAGPKPACVMARYVQSSTAKLGAFSKQAVGLLSAVSARDYLRLLTEELELFSLGMFFFLLYERHCVRVSHSKDKPSGPSDLRHAFRKQQDELRLENFIGAFNGPVFSMSGLRSFSKAGPEGVNIVFALPGTFLGSVCKAMPRSLVSRLRAVSLSAPNIIDATQEITITHVDSAPALTCPAVNGVSTFAEQHVFHDTDHASIRATCLRQLDYRRLMTSIHDDWKSGLTFVDAGWRVERAPRALCLSTSLPHGIFAVVLEHALIPEELVSNPQYCCMVLQTCAANMTRIPSEEVERRIIRTVQESLLRGHLDKPLLWQFSAALITYVHRACLMVPSAPAGLGSTVLSILVETCHSTISSVMSAMPPKRKASLNGLINACAAVGPLDLGADQCPSHCMSHFPEFDEETHSKYTSLHPPPMLITDECFRTLTNWAFKGALVAATCGALLAERLNVHLFFCMMAHQLKTSNQRVGWANTLVGDICSAGVPVHGVELSNSRRVVTGRPAQQSGLQQIEHVTSCSSSYLVAESLRYSRNQHAARCAVNVLRLWITSKLSHWEARLQTTIASQFHLLSTQFSCTPHEFFRLLAEEMAPRIIGSLLAPLSLLQGHIDCPVDGPPLIHDFCVCILQKPGYEAEVLAACAHIWLPALFCTDGRAELARRCMLEYGAFLLREFVAGPSEDVVGSKRKSSPMFLSPAKQAKTMGTDGNAARTPMRPGTAHSACLQFQNLPDVDKVLNVTQLMQAKGGGRYRYLQAAIHARVLLTCGNRGVIATSMSLLEAFSPAKIAFQSEHQELLETLVWQLSEAPDDTPHNRAAVALRSLANIILGTTTLLPPSTYPIKRIREASTQIATFSSNKEISAKQTGTTRTPEEGDLVSSIALQHRCSQVLFQLSRDQAGVPRLHSTGMSELSKLFHMPLELLFQRYLMLWLSMISQSVAKRDATFARKQRALLVLQRLLVRVGGDQKLDKHVPVIMGLLKLVGIGDATLAPLCCAVWDTLARLLSKETLLSYFGTIISTMVTVDTGWIAINKRKSTIFDFHAGTAEELRTEDATAPRDDKDAGSPATLAAYDRALVTDLQATSHGPGSWLLINDELDMNIAACNVFGVPVSEAAQVDMPKRRGGIDSFVRVTGPVKQAKFGRDSLFPPAFGGRLQARDIIQQSLQYLIVERAEDLSSAFVNVPCATIAPILRPYAHYFTQATGRYVVDARVKKLLQLLRNDYEAVQILSLVELNEIFVTNDSTFQRHVMLHSTDHVAPMINDIVTALLELATSTTSNDIRDAIAVCLGRLGAIDPSRVTISIRHDQGPELSDALVVAELLRSHLCKALRAAPDAVVQGKFGFSIQKILKYYASLHSIAPHSAGEVPFREMSAKPFADESSTGVAYEAGAGGVPLPKEFVRCLTADIAQAQLQIDNDGKARDIVLVDDSAADSTLKELVEIISPYWSSRLYSVSVPFERPAHATYFQSIVSRCVADGSVEDVAASSYFDEWIAAWTRGLIFQLLDQVPATPRKELWVACRPILQHDSFTAMYILPFLLREIFMHGSREFRESVASEMRRVLQVPATGRRVVVEDASHRPERTAALQHKAIQVMFSLVDTFRRWHSQRQDNENFAGAEGDALSQLVNLIPHQILADAAFYVHAYARAFQYLESHNRECRGGPWESARVGASSGVVADNAIGGLIFGAVPYSRVDLAYMQEIYAKIDEPDGMRGIAALRSRLADADEAEVSLKHLLTKERMIDYEHDDRWTDALLCYEQALQNRQSAYDADNSSSAARRMGEAELHGGLLRCLQNVGHLETALNHAVGVLGRRADLSPALTPYAVEAAWRLGEWQVLEKLLAFEAPSTAPQQAPVLASYKDIAQNYATSTGQALLWLQRSAEIVEARVIRSVVDPARHPAQMAMMRATDATLPSDSAPYQKGILPAVVTLAHGYAACTSYLDGESACSSLASLVSIGASFAALASATGAEIAVPPLQGDLHASLSKLLDSVDQARKDTMLNLSAAAMESYTRAYPFLLRLHCLCELQQAAGLLYTQDRDSRTSTCKQWDWDARLQMTTPTVAQREPLLALRRTIFHIFGLRDAEAQAWLDLARTARATGNAPTAVAALLHAAALGSDTASIQSAKLLYRQGEVHRALMEVEPVEKDLSAVVVELKGRLAASAGDPTQVVAAKRAALLEAKRILHATNWMVESRLAGEAVVVSRYKKVIELNENWEKGYFYLGRYFDSVFRTMIREDACPTSDRGAAAAWTGRRDAFLCNIIENYGKSLRFGHSKIFHSLPRLLTLYFDYGAAAAPLVSGAQQSSTSSEHSIRTGMVLPSLETLKKMTDILNYVRSKMPGFRWMTVLPQLASRICHRHADVHKFIESTLGSILYSFTPQASWMLLGLTKSEVKLRKQRAELVFQSVCKARPSEPKSSISLQERQLKVMSQTFDALIHTAQEIPVSSDKDKDRSYVVNVLSREQFASQAVLVPLQLHLTVNLTQKDVSEVSNGFLKDSPTIVRFERAGEYMLSKEKPKKLTILASDGRKYNFLCKQEKRGDLRKDARMMECASLINRLLTKDSEGRRRNLHLRTFTVIILKEDCGLLQWVPNTTGLRNEVTKAYASCGLPNPMITTRTIRPEFEDMQMTDADDAVKAAAFRSNFAPRFPAVFHKWFLSSYADPTAWFEARLAFTRSAAVWSMVGHIVGLGDRHGENILLDKSTGECVHVDFDCLFDKGMSLTRPEIVPFRLTANMLDGMGLCGYEGVFRRVSEATMAVLRGNKDMLLSVLESFIHDPLVEWAGKQRPPPVAIAADVHSTLAGAEKENKDGLRMVKRISERLDGFYNIGPEAMPSKPGWKSSRANAAGHRRFGASALSIEGQVHRLIKEATNDENLALMYIGWMPFL